MLGRIEIPRPRAALRASSIRQTIVARVGREPGRGTYGVRLIAPEGHRRQMNRTPCLMTVEEDAGRK